MNWIIHKMMTISQERVTMMRIIMAIQSPMMIVMATSMMTIKKKKKHLSLHTTSQECHHQQKMKASETRNLM
eukprot:15354005-Ditylum_brightwellii.AAC.1